MTDQLPDFTAFGQTLHQAARSLQEGMKPAAEAMRAAAEARPGDDQVTAHEAANHLGISPDTIDTWVRRGHLAPIPGTGRPRRFWMADVYTCETKRRTHWKHR